LPVAGSNIHIAPSIDYISVTEAEEARNSISEGR